jgi:hypothetical protein
MEHFTKLFYSEKNSVVQKKSFVDINRAFCKTFSFRKKALLFRKKAKPTLFRKRAPLISMEHFAKLFYSEKNSAVQKKSKTHFVQKKSSIDINGAFCKNFFIQKKTLLISKQVF